jgi:hypothetical protein
MKVPILNTAPSVILLNYTVRQRINLGQPTYLRSGSLAKTTSGSGMHIMRMSDDMLNTMVMIRWLMAVEHWTELFMSAGLSRTDFEKHTIWCRHRPIIRKWSTPDTKVANFQDDIRHHNIYS